MRKKWLIGGLIALVVIILIVLATRGDGKEIELETTSNFNQASTTVRLTGKLVPIESANLGFNRSGIVAYAPKKIGDTVERGALLAELNLAEFQANLLEAEAMVAAEVARLEELKLGTRPEELVVTQAEFIGAQASLVDAENNLTETLVGAYTSADNAVRNETDQLFIEPRSGNPDLVFSLLDQNSYVEPDFTTTQGILIEVKRREIEKMFVVWAREKNTVSSDVVVKNLNQIKIFLDDLALVTNSIVPIINLSQTTIDNYRAAVSEARTEINTAINDVIAAIKERNDAEAAFSLAKGKLLLDQAGSVPQVVVAQQAKVNQALAKVSTIEAQIAGSQIVAPFGGTIARYDTRVGEAVSANIELISLISLNNLEIEANVPEVHLGHLLVGKATTIEFDAFLNERFSGQITSIEPAETVVDGVVNFKIKISLNTNDSRLKSGLTANIEINQ